MWAIRSGSPALISVAIRAAAPALAAELVETPVLPQAEALAPGTAPEPAQATILAASPVMQALAKALLETLEQA